jgi:hypothetical protein
MTFISLVMTLIFGAIGLGLLLFGRSARRKALASQSWPTVAGTVTESEVKITQDSSGSGLDAQETTHYKPVVKYQYSVEGMEYAGSRIAFGAMNSAHSAANAVVARYPAGASVTVRYDPEKPAEAVLETKSGGGALLMVLGVVFLVFGAGSAVMGLVALVAG